MKSINIRIKSDEENRPFTEMEYEFDMTRPVEPYQPVSIVLCGCPFARMGLYTMLTLAISRTAVLRSGVGKKKNIVSQNIFLWVLFTLKRFLQPRANVILWQGFFPAVSAGRDCAS